MKLSELEANRSAWFTNVCGSPAQNGPEMARSSLSLVVASLAHAKPAQRRELFCKALILLLDVAHRAGLDFSELQTYRFNVDPGWRKALAGVCPEGLSFEELSTSFCCLWFAASSLKIWRQDLIRGAAAALRQMQLEEINR